jgi:predicted amidophosphoribosyltransferase
MTAPRRSRSVFEESAPLEHYLIAVPPGGDDTCRVCHGMVNSGYETCISCSRARSTLGSLSLDATAFISLAPRGEQMARDLYTYKLNTVPEFRRQQLMAGLSAVFWRWLAQHENCLATVADVVRFDAITTVPSTSGRDGEHPLNTLVSKIVAGSATRTLDTLALARSDLDPRAPAVDRFAATSVVRGRNILVVDDTWTTGAKMQSASASLKRAGAHVVGGVAIGRWLNPGYNDAATWLRRKKRRQWSWDLCCLE